VESANGAHPEVYAVALRAAADGSAARHARDSISAAKRASSLVDEPIPQFDDIDVRIAGGVIRVMEPRAFCTDREP
jgi:hypothetical protein